MGHGHGQARQHDHNAAFDDPEMVAKLEREAEGLSGFVTDALDVLGDLAQRADLTVDRVVDLGSGPGVATCLLAERFPAAHVVAVDGSQAMRDRAIARAAERGLGERVHAIQADLAVDLSVVGRADLVWASMALHHVDDETAALRRMFDLLEPGGLVGLVEADNGVREVSDYATLLRAVGFEVLVDQPGARHLWVGQRPST